MCETGGRRITMQLESLFETTFKTPYDAVYQSPARINLVGEHIDYNGGLVLPSAISLYIKGYVSKRDDGYISVYSSNFEDGVSVLVNEIEYNPKYNWANYVFGVFKILESKGYKIPSGLNILISSEIPVGSGLSSSAALLVLIFYIVNDQFKLSSDLKTIALLAKEVENNFCGVNSGIMDEAAIALGKKNKALLLDCSTFDYKYENISLGDYTFVVLKTNKPRKLIESKYNERVSECQRALSILKTKYNISNLCELKNKDLNEIKYAIKDKLLYGRVRHVITENERVHEFSYAMKIGDISLMGSILNASHESLKKDYEVTGEHLDTIYEAALEAGAIGARMTGAGFGGCAIALISKKDFESFKEKVDKKYFEKLKIHPDVLKVDIVDGPKKIK